MTSPNSVLLATKTKQPYSSGRKYGNADPGRLPPFLLYVVATNSNTAPSEVESGFGWVRMSNDHGTRFSDVPKTSEPSWYVSEPEASCENSVWKYWPRYDA